jgi:hypothetical protein
MSCTCPHFDASPVSRYILHRAPCPQAGEITDPAGKNFEAQPRNVEPEITEYSRGD